MGILAELRQSKDPSVLKELNEFLKFDTRLAEATVTRKFISGCIDRGEYPRYYWKTLRRSRISPTSTTLRRHAESHLETGSTGIDELQRNLCQKTTSLDHLESPERRKFEDYVQTVRNKRIEARWTKLLRSVQSVKAQATLPNNPERYVHNYSSVRLDKTLVELLSLGPKFCIARRNQKQLELETQFESLFSQTNDLKPSQPREVDYLKSTLVNCCEQYLRKGPRNKGPLTTAHLDSLRKLRENENILLTRPDKGSRIVLMDKTDYVEKLEEILSDRTKFSKSEKDRDRTETIEKQLTNVLKDLHKEGVLSDKEFEGLKPVGTTIPRMYGLPKIHKPGLPLRPILDMRNSPYHTIAKWLVEKLKPLQSCLYPRSLKDTFEFVEAIKNINVDGQTMLSLDVSSLFTNVPVVETIDFLVDFFRETNYPIGMTVGTLKELLTQCTQNVQFLCNGQLYRQIDGVAMGSPLGPFLANVFMGKVEQTSLKDTINDLKFYGRYVDDIFCMTSQTTDINGLVQKFNGAHPSLMFTAETETNNEIPFLDVLLHRQEDGSIQRKIFRKKTWTGQYINFHSFVPLNLKRNLVQGLAARVRRICSPETVETELQQLQNTLRENGYPERFILRNIRERATKPAVGCGEERLYF
ncbi:hypothetical protein SprV_0602220500 [Sparganum proliferum]